MNQSEALDLMRSGKNIFLTGKAGTGKSYTINQFKQEQDLKGNNMIMIAPTGISAINIHGSTIHSTFKMYGNYPDNTRSIIRQQVDWKNIKTIVIDEISMVSPDYIDFINHILKRERSSILPFGGIQMIFVGDPKQLPPVIPEYTEKEKSIKEQLIHRYGENLTFDKSESYKGNFLECELTDIKRQDDPVFIDLINKVRDGNTFVIGKFQKGNGDDETTHIVSTNTHADNINNKRLSEIQGESYVYEAEIEGDFNTKNCITPEELVLKVGARVMVTKNGNGLVNGDTGWVKSLNADSVTITVDRFNGLDFNIYETLWENAEYVGTGRNILGTFKQIPLKLSWAITVHKSQGLTIDNVCVHISKYMGKEMIYTAISRATTFKKLFIGLKN